MYYTYIRHNIKYVEVVQIIENLPCPDCLSIGSFDVSRGWN